MKNINENILTSCSTKNDLYNKLIVDVDIISLCPTMIILHNISFDKVNCECCIDNSESKVSKDITKDCRIQKDYWICRQNEDVFPQKIRIFKEERLKRV